MKDDYDLEGKKRKVISLLKEACDTLHGIEEGGAE